MGKGVAFRIGRILDQTLPGARPGLGTLPRYEALGNLHVEIVKMQGLI